MNQNWIKNLAGVILVLIGVVCLVVYHFKPVSNILLALGLVLEFIGILAFIFLNRPSKKA